jgi:threonine synthase
VHYISTRGYGPVNFKDALIDGVAPDGGLYVPANYPLLSMETLESFSFQTYEDCAERVLSSFIDIPHTDLKRIVKNAYKDFQDIEITPLTQFEEDHWIMELHHGPTMSLKDISMQLVAGLLAYYKNKDEQKLDEDDIKPTCLIASTSGDGGPAMVDAFKDAPNTNMFILFPRQRVGLIQRMQMTTCMSANIHPISIDGNAADCHRITSELLKDHRLCERIHACSMNAMSIARILPQIVYYFFAWSRIRDILGGKPLAFSIPGGSFGDVMAAYIAMQCGAPISKIIVANNQNDILTRFINDNDYSVKPVKASSSVSLDVTSAPNIERLLFDLYGRKADRVKSAMETFEETGVLPKLSSLQMDEMQSTFVAETVSEIDTLKMISEADATQDILLCPHTAVAMQAARQQESLRPVVSLMTADAIKFPTTLRAATGKQILLDDSTGDLLDKDEKYVELEASTAAVKHYILDAVMDSEEKK